MLKATEVEIPCCNSLGGEFFERWFAVVDDVRQPVTPDLIGYVCAVGVSDKILIRRIERGRKGRFRLISATEPPVDNAIVEWGARIRVMTQR